MGLQFIALPPVSDFFALHSRMIPLSILYSCPLDPIKHPAPGQHVASVIHELSLRGHRMTLIHPGTPLPGIGTCQQFALNLKKNRWIGRLLVDLQYAAALFKILRKNEYNVVYHRLEKWSVIPLVLFKCLKIPVILEVNADIRAELDSLNAGTITRSLYPICEYLQLRLATKIVVVSEGIGKSLIENTAIAKNKTVVIENGANTDLYFPRDRDQACATLGLNPAQKYVTFSGSFQPWQGLDTLIDSVLDVVGIHPHAHFLIIGDGRQRAAVEQLIKIKNIESSVTLTGWLPPENVAQYLAASDVCVAPYSLAAALDPVTAEKDWKSSLMKCSPLKIYTYMAMGKPVVAAGFQDGGERLVQWEAGLAFKPGSASELASAIVKILNNKGLADRLGARAAERLKHHHTWAQVAEKIDLCCLQ